MRDGGLLARGRQDAQCAPGKLQEDGCSRSSPEGHGDEDGGAGDAGLVIEGPASSPVQPATEEYEQVLDIICFLGVDYEFRFLRPSKLHGLSFAFKPMVGYSINSILHVLSEEAI
jgi:hypothetical protein